MRKTRLTQLAENISYKNHFRYETALDYARRIEEEEFRELRENPVLDLDTTGSAVPAETTGLALHHGPVG